MRLLKATLAGLLILALGAMWTNRGSVVEAYRSDEPAASIRLSGVDLAYEAAEIAPTPYRMPSAPDTRGTPRTAGFPVNPATAAPHPSLTGGDAVLQGTVSGPDGPIVDAVVHIERHTDHGTISIDLSTDEEGRWAMDSLVGGRYRVRAWLPGQLTMGRSEVRFVADDEVADFDFSLWGIDPAPAFDFVDGGPMYEGVPATVAVVLGWRSIDDEGLVVVNPLPGAEVTIETTAQVEVLTGQPSVTGGDGVARILLRCVPTSVAPLDDPLGDPLADPLGAVATPGGQTAGVALATTTQDPPAVGPGGSLTARSGVTVASFALPGCLPIPEPEPVPGDGTADPAPTDPAPTDPAPTAPETEEPTDA